MDTIQHPFMLKTLNEVDTEVLQHMKGQCDEHTANITLKVKKL